MKRVYRYSAIKQFRNCPRQWWLRYNRGLYRTAEADSTASVGTQYHRELEAHYRGEDRPTLEGDPKTVALVGRMYEGYLDWLANTGVDQGLTIVALERQIEVPFGTILGDEVWLTGKLDMEVVDEWGFKKIIDHKSVQNLDQADHLYLDDQGRTYSLLRRLEGDPVDAFVHNQARRVMRTATATPPFYQRVEVSYGAPLLDSHEKHLHATLEQMVYAEQKLEAGADHHGLVPPNPSRDCGWQCPMVHVCPMFDDGSDAEAYLLEFFTKADTLEAEREEGA